ncbi:hypothetical protein NDU88_004307 [Pleurodeles waltl]|uniref:Uncharacterized protein n=1 Tax=Pleurodeles waltl TaxID=8319 RepID=A0AAV7V4B0_PLEWA|nr:hypothetical protein NDU88_004307 [Pleurodeles waltl]
MQSRERVLTSMAEAVSGESADMQSRERVMTSMAEPVSGESADTSMAEAVSGDIADSQARSAPGSSLNIHCRSCSFPGPAMGEESLTVCAVHRALQRPAGERRAQGAWRQRPVCRDSEERRRIPPSATGSASLDGRDPTPLLPALIGPDPRIRESRGGEGAGREAGIEGSAGSRECGQWGDTAAAHHGLLQVHPARDHLPESLNTSSSKVSERFLELAVSNLREMQGNEWFREVRRSQGWHIVPCQQLYVLALYLLHVDPFFLWVSVQLVRLK